MSTLFEEAIADAKKLKEMAEQNAKNAIIESLSPTIKKMIEREIADSASEYLLEEDAPQLSPMSDETSVPPVGGDSAATPTALPSSAPLATSAEPVGASLSSPTPTDVAPIALDKGLDVPLPDKDGKIVVDFSDIFNMAKPGVSSTEDQLPITTPLTPSPESSPAAPLVPPAEETPAAPSGDLGLPTSPPMPPPAQQQPGQEEQQPPLAENKKLFYNEYKLNLEQFKTKLKTLTETKATVDVTQRFAKDYLIGLYALLQELKDQIPSNLFSLNENYLEVLYKNIKETKITNNYNRTSVKKGTIDMSTLKEFAKKLFEEADMALKDEKKMDVTNPTEKTIETAGTHAMSVTKPDVDTSDASAPKKVPGVEEKMWAEELERLEAEMSEAMKEDDGVSKEDELDEATAVEEDLEESHGMDTDGKMTDATQEDPKDKGDGKVKHEGMEQVYEVDEDELAEAIRSFRKESIKKQMKSLEEKYTALCEGEEEVQAECMGGEMESGVGGGGSHDVHDINIHLDLAGLGLGQEDGGMGEEMPVDVGAPMDDAPPTDSDDDMSSLHGDLADDDDQMPVVDDDATDDEEPKKEPSKAHELKESKTTKKQAVVAQNASLVEGKKLVKVVKELKNQIVEKDLLTAKLIYLNRFLQRDNLSRKQRQKIVEYLDNAKSIQEAREIYSKIKKVLDESTSSASRSRGSASQATKTGSATIAESVDQTEGPETRWMKLAGIKK